MVTIEQLNNMAELLRADCNGIIQPIVDRVMTQEGLMRAVQGLNISALIAGMHSRVEALEQSSRNLSNLESIIEDKVKAAVTNDRSGTGTFERPILEK